MNSLTLTQPAQLDCASHPLPSPPVAILGVPFDNVTIAEAVELITGMIDSRRPHYVVTANVDFLVQAQADLELRRILFDAHLVLCDGTPVLWASRLLGNPLAERVAGADLVPLLIELAVRRRYRLFFLGATPEANARAMANLGRQYRNLIAGCYSPPFNKLLEMDHEEISRRIRAAEPDLLFVSFGCPKQEKWIAMHYRQLGVPVAIGVGATIDFLAGQVKRAPAWMQRSGTEWLFRLAQEPRRLGPRYARDLWVFAGALLQQWWKLKRRTSPASPMEKRAGESSTLNLITLPARLDLEATRELGESLMDSVSNGHHCLLDTANVHFIDSTGVGLLVHLHKRGRARGNQLLLVAPSPALVSALRLMRLEEFFAIAPDVSAAERLLENRGQQHASAGTIDNRGNFAQLHWQGEITAANAEEVWRFTNQQLTCAAEASQPEVTIDLGAVRFLDSSGLGVMIRAKKLAHRHGTKLVFTNIPPPVRNVLHLAQMETYLLGLKPVLIGDDARSR